MNSAGTGPVVPSGRAYRAWTSPPGPGTHASSRRTGKGPPREDVDTVHRPYAGVGQVEADVDQLDPSAITKGVNRFARAERDGQGSVHGGPVGRAGLDV